LVVQVLGLEDNGILTVTTLEDNPIKASRGGWVFRNPDKDRKVVGIRRDDGGSASSSVDDITDLRALYDYLNPNFKGRCTAPLLIDLKQEVIVSNESSDMVRMLPRLLEAIKAKANNDNDNNLSPASPIILCPADKADLIEETNEWVYRLLNNGVYQCGFSTTQAAYDVASANVKEGLTRCETILSSTTTNKFLCGDTFTEADIRLLPTMLRFDGVYAPLFKAGGTHLRLAVDYPAIDAWLKRCWQTIPGVSTSIDIPDATSSYYKQLFPLNPGGILPTMVTAKDLGLE
jgi:glutathionyl-hydroquinone reductase